MMRWRLDDLKQVHGRRYLLRRTALEFTFSGGGESGSSVFIAFTSFNERRACYTTITRQPTLKLSTAFTGSLRQV